MFEFDVGSATPGEHNIASLGNFANNIIEINNDRYY